MSETQASQSPKTQKIGILTGPSSTGKSHLSLEFAKRCPSLEIINADSLLIYRDVNIGTAKPTSEELHQVPHHLIDVCSPDQTFTAGDFFRAVQNAREDIRKRQKRALIVGGSGFYLKALLYGLWQVPKTPPTLRQNIEAIPSPELYQKLYQLDAPAALRIGNNDRYRLVRAIEIYELTGKTPTQFESEQNKTPFPEYELWVIDRDPKEVQARISHRTQHMLDQGLVEETKHLKNNYPESRVLSAVGYAQTLDYLNGLKPSGRKTPEGLEGLKQEINLATRQLVKRQRTWFRSEKNAHFFKLDQDQEALLERFHAIYLNA